MVPPLHRNLSMQGPLGRTGWSCATNMHPNPELYKYYWWVFTLESEEEGFLSNPENRLCTYDAMRTLQTLNRQKKPYLLYNKRYPRRNSLFNPESEKWKHAQWFPCLADDTDPDWKGHKWHFNQQINSCSDFCQISTVRYSNDTFWRLLIAFEPGRGSGIRQKPRNIEAAMVAAQTHASQEP